MVRHEIDGRVVLTTSFGIEDQIIADAVFTQNLEIDVVTFDTGRLFPETFELWARTEARYRRRVRALYPDRDSLETLIAGQGVNGFRASIEARHVCCGVRKVEPLRRALAGFDAWISGRKRFHGALRTFLPVIELSGAKIKINPLARWSKLRIEEEFARHGLPRHPLEADGFLSIGCLPCTGRVAAGADHRAGRWAGRGKTECGIHL